MAITLIAVLAVLIVGAGFALKSERGKRIRDYLSLPTFVRGIQEKIPAPPVQSILHRGLDQLARRSLTTMHSKVLPDHAVFDVHPDAYRQMAPIWPRLAAELATTIDDMARAEGWETRGVSFSLRANSTLGRWEVDVQPIYPDDDDVITVNAGSVSRPMDDDDDEPTQSSNAQWQTTWLIEIAGRTPQELTPERPLIIGKSTNCDITIRSSQVSRRHVRLLWNPTLDLVEIEDLDSTNGTFLDGRAIQPRSKVVVRGDTVIGLGDHDQIKLVYRAVKANRR